MNDVISVIKKGKSFLVGSHVGPDGDAMASSLAMGLGLEQLGKKVVVEGRSMKTNVEIAKELGILKIKPTTIIPAESMEEHPDDKKSAMAKKKTYKGQ